MTAPVPIPQVSTKPQLDLVRLRRYLIAGTVAVGGLLGGAALVVAFVPATYTSAWTLILPGTGTRSTIELDNLGSASSSSESSYANPSLDPRANYKVIIESDPVLAAAAARVGMNRRQFGKPRIKLAEQTSVLELSFTGSSPDLARKKARALQEAIQTRLSQLRTDENRIREQSVQGAIRAAKDKLSKAQKDLLAYGARTGIASKEQFRDMAFTIEALNKQRSEALAQERSTARQLAQLTTTLGLTPTEAASAFVLQADRLFQDSAKTHSEASALLTDYRSKWGPNHPLVVKELARQQQAQASTIARGNRLLGRSIGEAGLQKLNLTVGSSISARETLLQQMVVSQTQQQGHAAQAQELTIQMEQLRDRLKKRINQQTTLEALQRNLQVAEAVFASSLARVSTSKTDVFASYPLVQTLSDPDLPEEPSFPSPSFTWAGALAAALLVTLGLGLAWNRDAISSGIQER